MASSSELTAEGFDHTPASDNSANSPAQATDATTPKQKGGIGALLIFAGGHKVLTYIGCALSGVSMLLGFVPYLCIWFVARDLIAVAPNWSAATNLETYAWSALWFSIASLLLYLLALLCTHLAAFRTATNIRKRCSEHLVHASLGYFDTHASGALRRVIDGCAGATEDLLAHKMPDTAGSAVLIIGMLAIFFVFDWRMGLACLCSVVGSLICLVAMMGGRGRTFMEQYQNALVNMSKTGTEYVRGVPVVKVFQQTVYSFKAFHDAIQQYSQMAEDYAVKACRKAQTVQLVLINGVVIFLVPTVLFLLPETTDIAGFVTNFAFYAIFSAVISTAMTRIMFLVEALMMSQDATTRIQSVLSAPTIDAPENPQQPHDSSIAFQNVTFSYEGAEQPALDSISFTIQPGETVALVGPSGGGKTTAASLVPRFWDVTAGSIAVGGVDVRDMDPHVLMDHVAFVFQNSRLFKQSILDNVRAARPQATREEALAALEAAQCNDILEKLPEGIDTVIGTKGVYLSGGEQQRIALARAILKDAPIVVLDEATAFADPENEALIQAAFSRLTQGRTVLMIAHRLSTVVGADRIVVLSHGRVAEQGTHDELLAAGGVYASMWEKYQSAVSWKIERGVA